MSYYETNLVPIKYQFISWFNSIPLNHFLILSLVQTNCATETFRKLHTFNTFRGQLKLRNWILRIDQNLSLIVPQNSAELHTKIELNSKPFTEALEP